MKEWTFNIDIVSKDLFFPKERVKTKIQVINILLEASRYIMSNPQLKRNESKGQIKLVVDKMSRLFFISEKKSFSIAFPFIVNEVDENINLSFKNNIKVNSYLIAQTKSAINCNSFDNDCVLGFADSLYDIKNEDDDEYLWFFIRELMLFEDGYIRYDNDPSGHQEAIDKGWPHRHPLDHYDLFYTNGATFKIGLKRGIKTKQFINLLNRQTDCDYLKN